MDTKNLLAQYMHRVESLFEEDLQAGSLYLVGTPLGNLGDLSPRALVTLAKADWVAAEDTRRTALLLAQFGLKKRLLSHHEHNLKRSSEQIVERLLDGASIALVSDAGMPGISDPGGPLCARCLEEGIPVITVPGPTALTTVAAATGFVEKEFQFLGFLPVKGKERRLALESLRTSPRPVVLYEAPHRLEETLEDLQKLGLGACCLGLGRELTKRYEEIRRTSVDELLAAYREDKERIRGEYALVLHNPASYLEGEKGEPDVAELAQELEGLMAEGLSRRAAARALAERYGGSSRDYYRLTLEDSP